MTNLIPGAPVGTAELPFDNTLGDGKSYGSEISLTMSVTPSWRLNGNYSWLINEFSESTSVNPYERGSPRHQVVLRSSHDLTSRLVMNAQLRYVDVVQSVPSYITADLQFTYRLNDRVDISLVGQNLLDKQHPEHAPFVVLSTASEVPRSFYCKVTARF
jgi:iron complex outermembrane receptor protein